MPNALYVYIHYIHTFIKSKSMYIHIKTYPCPLQTFPPYCIYIAARYRCGHALCIHEAVRSV